MIACNEGGVKSSEIDYINLFFIFLKMYCIIDSVVNTIKLYINNYLVFALHHHLDVFIEYK